MQHNEIWAMNRLNLKRSTEIIEKSIFQWQSDANLKWLSLGLTMHAFIFFIEHLDKYEYIHTTH